MSFDPVTHKCAVVVADTLPTGLAANAASVVTLTLGHLLGSDLVGPDVQDADGARHPGLVLVPVPVLVSTPDGVAAVARSATDDDAATVVPFSSLAQSCKTYSEYQQRVALLPTDGLDLVAVGLVAPRRLVNRLTGSLPLLR